MKSKNKPKQKIEKRTWYGIKATIIDGPGFLHTAGFGFFLIPHPPVVNWLLRRGLAQNNRRAFIRVHEFEHFQSAPFILIYAFILFAFSFLMDDVGITAVIVLLISCQALWEIFAEILTIASDARLYRNAYANVSIIPRIVFWSLAGILTIAGWAIVLA